MAAKTQLFVLQITGLGGQWPRGGLHHPDVIINLTNSFNFDIFFGNFDNRREGSLTK